MSSPTQLDQLIAETVPRTSLRDALVMFLAGLASLFTDDQRAGYGDLAAELEAKKHTVADALVANTPVAPAGLGAGHAALPKHLDPNLPDSVSGLDTYRGETARQVLPGAALFPHEVAVGSPDQTLPAEERVDHSLDDLHEQVAADAELRQREALATDDAGIVVDPNL